MSETAEIITATGGLGAVLGLVSLFIRAMLSTGRGYQNLIDHLTAQIQSQADRIAELEAKLAQCMEAS